MPRKNTNDGHVLNFSIKVMTSSLEKIFGIILVGLGHLRI